MKKKRIASYFPTYEELKRMGKRRRRWRSRRIRKRTIGSSRRTLNC